MAPFVPVGDVVEPAEDVDVVLDEEVLVGVGVLVDVDVEDEVADGLLVRLAVVDGVAGGELSDCVAVGLGVRDAKLGTLNERETLGRLLPPPQETTRTRRAEMTEIITRPWNDRNDARGFMGSNSSSLERRDQEREGEP